MGGMDSGRRWYWGAKNSTGDYRSIDVRSWKWNGWFAPHQSFWYSSIRAIPQSLARYPDSLL